MQGTTWTHEGAEIPWTEQAPRGQQHQFAVHQDPQTFPHSCFPADQPLLVCGTLQLPFVNLIRFLSAQLYALSSPPLQLLSWVGLYI